MLGKGLESLIPPQNNGQGNVQGDGAQDGVTNHEAAQPQPPPQQQQPPVQKPIEQPREHASQVAQQNAPRAAHDGERREEKKPQEVESIFHIEVDKITPNPDQPRRNFNQDALRDLANSIREFGFLQP